MKSCFIIPMVVDRNFVCQSNFRCCINTVSEKLTTNEYWLSLHNFIRNNLKCIGRGHKRLITTTFLKLYCYSFHRINKTKKISTIKVKPDIATHDKFLKCCVQQCFINVQRLYVISCFSKALIVVCELSYTKWEFCQTCSTIWKNSVKFLWVSNKFKEKKMSCSASKRIPHDQFIH